MANHTIFLCLPQFYTFIAEIDDKQKKISYDSKLRRSARTKSGGPSLGRSPARTSSVTPPIKDKSKNSGKQGRHDFPSRAAALLFFLVDLRTTATPAFSSAAFAAIPNRAAICATFMDSSDFALHNAP
jgi:hypothetical protein